MLHGAEHPDVETELAPEQETHPVPRGDAERIEHVREPAGQRRELVVPHVAHSAAAAQET